MPAGYTTRDVGDPSQMKKNKQSMADLKLRRLTELNNRLREDLERERIPVSQAAKRLVPISSALKTVHLSLTISAQHNCVHQQHEGLHGTIGMGNGRQEG
jgi:hypothetical protein